MATTNHSIHHANVSLKLPAKVADLIAYVTGVVHAMTNNPAFAALAAAVSALSAAVTALQAAETLALTRAMGAVAARNDRRAVVVSLLRQLAANVQAIADTTPENGATILQSAGLPVRKAPLRPTRVFGARPGPVSGSAKLTATVAGRRASYLWEYSTDGGKTWVSSPVTLQSKTTVTGLPVGTSVLFRYKSVTKTGEADWSQGLALFVK